MGHDKNTVSSVATLAGESFLLQLVTGQSKHLQLYVDSRMLTSQEILLALAAPKLMTNAVNKGTRYHHGDGTLPLLIGIISGN